MRILIVIIAAMLLWLPALAYYNPGQPTGFVNDFAGMLNVREKTALEQKLQNYDSKTNHEISIAIVSSLKGDTIENFAVKLFEDWKIGKAKFDNGILLLVARDEREVRIEVGYGLEGAVTDLESFWIIKNTIAPAFVTGAYAKGLDSAVDALAQAASEEIVPVGGSSQARPTGADDQHSVFLVPFILALFILNIIASLLALTKQWWPGGVAGGLAGAAIGLLTASFFTGLIAFGVFLPLGLLFNYRALKRYNLGLPLISFGSRRGPFDGGGLGGGGGFGGFGGGRSGGGGASGRW